MKNMPVAVRSIASIAAMSATTPRINYLSVLASHNAIAPSGAEKPMQYGPYVPKPEDCFVATITSICQKQVEHTESLYFDIKTQQFFVLIEDEPHKNMKVGAYHEIRRITESEVQILFNEKDERLQILRQFLKPSRRQRSHADGEQ